MTEAEHTKYSHTYTGATRTAVGTIVEGLVTNTAIIPGSLYITKEVVPYKDGEHFPTDYEFTFRVTFRDKDGNLIKNTEFKLENNYDTSITARSTDENGVMIGWLRHGETVHIQGIPDGATVDVEEIDLPTDGNYTLKGYRSRNQSGDTSDNDGTVTINSEQNATVVVTNTYTPKPTAVQIDVTAHKTLISEGTVLTDVKLGFAVEKWNSDTLHWENVSKAEDTWDKDNITQATAIKDFDIGTVVLDGFTEAGVYTYRVVEVEPAPATATPGLAYDKTVHTIIVTVVDNNGRLQASVTDENGNPIVDSDNDGILDLTAGFTNVFNYAPVSVEIVKAVDNQSNTPHLSLEGFRFAAYEANSNWKMVDHGGKANITYSEKEYTIAVAISLDENNQLVATLTQNGESVTEVVAAFENVFDYTPVPNLPNNPQTGDNTNLYLWFALLIVSCGGILGAVLCNRKKNQDEKENETAAD